MSHRYDAKFLRYLRNDLNVKQVLHALEIPWRRDDQKVRFICPCCEGLDTSLHVKVNLARCFSCDRNFNPIDLVMVGRRTKFVTAVKWLQALVSVLATEEGEELLSMQAFKTMLR